MSAQSMLTARTKCILITAALAVCAPAQAGEAGAFVGGVLATKVLGTMERRTRAEEYQAYSAPRQVQPVQPAAPAPSGQTTQQKLDQLDKLAAGGYITPQEYKAKKKAIIDSM